MVAYVDLVPVPTAALFLTVPVPLATGGWTWGELPRLAGALAWEYVYTAHECEALVNSYGTMLGRMIRTIEADRFCVTVRGRVTGIILRRAEWTWDAHELAYVPTGEALDGWRTAARAYWEATGEMIDARGFVAHETIAVDDPPTQLRRQHCAPWAEAA